jgi:hypothetical protein
MIKKLKIFYWEWFKREAIRQQFWNNHVPDDKFSYDKIIRLATWKLIKLRKK